MANKNKNALEPALKVLLSATLIVISVELAYECAKQMLENSVSFETAVSITTFIEGAPSPEAVEALYDYAWLLRTMAICIAAYSAVFVTYSIFRPAPEAVENQHKPVQKFFASMMARVLKTLCFAFIFWGLFRVFPFEYFTPGTHKPGMFWLLTFCMINLVLTAAIYKGGFALWNQKPR